MSIKRPIYCITTGQTFDDVKSASLSLYISKLGIVESANLGRSTQGYHFEWYDKSKHPEPQVGFVHMGSSERDLRKSLARASARTYR